MRPEQKSGYLLLGAPQHPAHGRCLINIPRAYSPPRRQGDPCRYKSAVTPRLSILQGPPVTRVNRKVPTELPRSGPGHLSRLLPCHLCIRLQQNREHAASLGPRQSLFALPLSLARLAPSLSSDLWSCVPSSLTALPKVGPLPRVLVLGFLAV